jgi:hypothetical protein
MAKLFTPPTDTKTAKFLRPLLGIEMAVHSPSYIGTYLGDATLMAEELT